jgi:Serine dehydrogenase proteinase
VGFSDRIGLIKEIETIRQSTVICFLTSLRPNLPAQISDDAVRVFFDHLLLLPERPAKKIDLFLCSNGGAGTVPWRLIALLREFTETLGVLIPFRAYSAATLIALGADEIVMHPFAEIGPIDPTVSNEYNPIDPNTKRQIGISVEDVKAYISFIKSTVGIQHEDELVKTIEILANKVHPLALGNVERFISQSRLVARKILLTHMKDTPNHIIDEIIDTLASKLFFHGHPINRKEAREELKLKVAEHPAPEVETAMWSLYKDFEAELENRVTFDPLSAIFQAQPPLTSPAPGQAAIVPPGTEARMKVLMSIVETTRLSSCFSQELRFVVAGSGQQFEPLVRSETLAQGWSETPAPRPAPAK